jgi:hypothetical protein
VPQMTFPLTGDSLIAPALIGLDSTALIAAQASGIAIPPPLQVSAEIDTGCNVTAVRPHVLQHFRLVPVARHQTTTAAGGLTVNLFEVSLSICPLPGNASPLLTAPSLVVQELHHAGPNVDVLIGTDVILRGSLLIDGPNGQFTIFY